MQGVAYHVLRIPTQWMKVAIWRNVSVMKGKILNMRMYFKHEYDKPIRFLSGEIYYIRSKASIHTSDLLSTFAIGLTIVVTVQEMVQVIIQAITIVE